MHLSWMAGAGHSIDISACLFVCVSVCLCVRFCVSVSVLLGGGGGRCGEIDRWMSGCPGDGSWGKEERRPCSGESFETKEGFIYRLQVKLCLPRQ